jgi:hypothetical protein
MKTRFLFLKQSFQLRALTFYSIDEQSFTQIPAVVSNPWKPNSIIVGRRFIKFQPLGVL